MEQKSPSVTILMKHNVLYWLLKLVIFRVAETDSECDPWFVYFQGLDVVYQQKCYMIHQQRDISDKRRYIYNLHSLYTETHLSYYQHQNGEVQQFTHFVNINISQGTLNNHTKKNSQEVLYKGIDIVKSWLSRKIPLF